MELIHIDTLVIIKSGLRAYSDASCFNRLIASVVIICARISLIQTSQIFGIIKSYWQSIIANFEANASNASQTDVVAEQKTTITNNSNSNPESKDKDKEKEKEKNKPKKKNPYWQAIKWGIVTGLVLSVVVAYFTGKPLFQ